MTGPEREELHDRVIDAALAGPRPPEPLAVKFVLHADGRIFLESYHALRPETLRRSRRAAVGSPP